LQAVTDAGNSTTNEIYTNGLNIRPPGEGTMARLTGNGSFGKLVMRKANGSGQISLYGYGNQYSDYLLPDVPGTNTLPITINGQFADANGNINVHCHTSLLRQ
jgi:hypothetical protein